MGLGGGVALEMTWNMMGPLGRVESFTPEGMKQPVSGDSRRIVDSGELRELARDRQAW
jgi:hypothetical protein